MKYLTTSERTASGKEGGKKQWHLISMDTTHRDGRKPISHGVRCWDTSESMLQWLSSGIPKTCPMPHSSDPSSIHAYTCHTGFRQKIPSSFPSGSPPFFLSLQDPEPEVDGTRVEHGLKQRKGTWWEDEAEMPTPPPHGEALHDTPLYISGSCYFAAFCLR